MAATRVQLSDGRYLAFKEGGVPRVSAKVHVVVAHGLGGSRHALFPLSQELVEEHGIYMVGFDRAGYGDSDPSPDRSIKSEALDVAQLADHLKLGKFYLIGISIGGYTAWGCIKYIPERLAGVAMAAPAINYWWSCFPPSLSKQAFGLRVFLDRCQLRIAHHAPWLLHWWNAQKWLNPQSFSNLDESDHKVLGSIGFVPSQQEKKPEEVAESMHRDLKVQFGKWEFDPAELPELKDGAQVHIWQGDKDYLVPVLLQRHLCKVQQWIHYHEVPNAGHLFFLVPGKGDEMMVALISKAHEATVAS